MCARSRMSIPNNASGSETYDHPEGVQYSSIHARMTSNSESEEPTKPCRNPSVHLCTFRIRFTEEYHSTDSILASIVATGAVPRRWWSSTERFDRQIAQKLCRFRSLLQNNVNRTVSRNGNYDAQGYRHLGYLLIGCFSDVVAHSFPHQVRFVQGVVQTALPQQQRTSLPDSRKRSEQNVLARVFALYLALQQPHV